MVDAYNSEAARKGRERAAKNRINRPYTPKFKVGDRIHHLVIEAVAGHLPIEHQGDSRPQRAWHYVCRCKCGNAETITQKQLVGHRGRTKCIDCAQSTLFGRDKRGPIKPPSADLDFARIRLCSREMLLTLSKAREEATRYPAIPRS